MGSCNLGCALFQIVGCHLALVLTLRPGVKLTLDHKVYIGIISAPGNLARRTAVREAWLTELRSKGVFQAEFIIGRAPIGGVEGLKSGAQGARAKEAELAMEKELADEEQKYGDIRRVPALEAYAELPAKVLGLFAHGVQEKYDFVVKIDDDQMFSPSDAERFFQSRPPEDPLYAGNYLWSEKHYNSQLGADGKFTPYFGGPCYALSLPLATKIAEHDLLHSAAYESYGSTSEDVDMGKWVKAAQDNGMAVKIETFQLSSALPLKGASLLQDA
eukprot:TRINITY_DN38619_c0_g1_i1.p1 TRINITY_DN38619_c0_g1~~TRINITY_DN38619_c0_g1_i1.p1  ORF type:complete len:273 (+),score=60.30 TRINITY_DN38619_c0_g1_i1:73-891(+)